MVLLMSFQYLVRQMLFIILFILLRSLLTLDELSSGLYNRFLLTGYFFIAPGGWNVELTFISFLLVLLRGRNVYWPMFVVFIALEIVFQSRIALLILILSFFVVPGRKINSKYLIYIAILILSILLALSVPGVNEIGVISRLLDITLELTYFDAGLGRLYAFQSGYSLLEENLFGYGVGMGIPAVLEYVGFIRDANFHNIYIQIFVEGGIVALALLVFIVFSLFREVISGRFKNRFGCVAMMYFLSGLVQFNGYDTIGWVFVGLAYGFQRRVS